MSEWLELMLAEINRKRQEAEEAEQEERRRKEERNDKQPQRTDQSK